MNRFSKTLLIVAIAAIPLLGIALFAGAVTLKSLLAVAGLLAVGMALPVQSLNDAAVKVSKALPGSGTTVTNTGHDLGRSANANDHCGFELVIEAPALTTGQLADAATIAYVVYHAASSTFSDEVSLYGTVLTQTGASSAGAAAATKRVGLPVDVSRYIRVKATLSTGDCSASEYVTRLVPVVSL